MATFFGEILPVVSRAVDEDDDNDEPEELQWWFPFLLLHRIYCGIVDSLILRIKWAKI